MAGKKKKLQPIRLILAGIVGAGLYFYIFVPLLSELFLFDFMSLQAWKDKYQEFLDFKWQINNPFDVALLLSMLLWIPFFFVFWRVLYQIACKFQIKLPKRKIQKKVLDLQKTRQPFVPQKLPAAQISKEYKAPVLPGQQGGVSASGTVKSHTNLVQVIKDSAALARNYKVEIFQHILLEGFRVPLAVSTDARAVLIEVVNKRGVNWSVEFADEVEKSNWYSDGGNMEAALGDLIGVSRSLAKSEPNSEVLSAVLIPSGRILNAKPTIEYLRSKGVYLLGLNDGEPKEDLQSLESFLTEMFELKSGENAGRIKPVGQVPVPPVLTETVDEIPVNDEPVNENTDVQLDESLYASDAEFSTLDEEEDFSDTDEDDYEMDGLLSDNVLDDAFLTDVEEMEGTPQ